MVSIEKSKSDEVCEEILDAAWARLNQYGLAKTTMVEIAQDCNMSAANLYRYFKNKNDIAGACCERAMEIVATKLRAVVRQNNVSATEKLRQYALQLVESNLESNRDCGNVGELVANMTANNVDILHKKLNVRQSLLAEILAQGNANGEFEVADVMRVAETIYVSLVAFDVPIFVGIYPDDDYRRHASQVMDLILLGLNTNKSMNILQSVQNS